MSYKEEFSDFGELDVELPQGFIDNSRHNDACPCFIKGDEKKAILVYIDYKDVEKREFEDEARFQARYEVNEEVVANCASDDWDDILEFIKTHE